MRERFNWCFKFSFRKSRKSQSIQLCIYNCGFNKVIRFMRKKNESLILYPQLNWSMKIFSFFNNIEFLLWCRWYICRHFFIQTTPFALGGGGSLVCLRMPQFREPSIQSVVGRSRKLWHLGIQPIFHMEHAQHTDANDDDDNAPLTLWWLLKVYQWAIN